MGYFAEEHARRAAERRARMPKTAQALEAFRKAFGPGVELLAAQEGAERFKDPGAFASDFAACGDLHDRLSEAQRTCHRGDKREGFVCVPGDHPRKSRL